MKRIILTIISVSISLYLLAQDTQRKVLFIGIDGCRYDAIAAANTPAIDNLLSSAIYSAHGLTNYPTWSGTGWSNMLTGVWHTKHGVTDNTFTGSNYGAFPDFLSRAEAYNPGLSTYSVVHWSPLNNNIIQSIDHKINVPTDLEVRDNAVSILTNNNPDILFVAFDDVDHAGHSHGFSPDIPEYLEQIELTDQYISEIIAALKSRPTYDQEDWLVMLTTDHGGTSAGHGGGTLEERTIFTIYSNPEFDALNISRNQLSSTETFDQAHFNPGTFAQPNDQLPFEFGDDQDFTIEFWVKAIEYSGDPSFISNKNWDSGRNPGFVISAQQGQYWKVNIGDGVDRLDVQGGYIQPGQWHHLAVSFDRDALMKAYEDGAIVGFYSMNTIDDINSGLPLVINQDGTTSYSFDFEGNYRDIRIWNAVIPESTITEWAVKPLTTSHPFYHNLIANWRCEDGAGNLLEDAGPGNNDCIITGNLEWNTEVSDTFSVYDYSVTPGMPDNALTALSWLCIPVQESWNLDGKSWVDACIINSTVENPELSQYTILPNPTSDIVQITGLQASSEAKEIALLDMSGRQLSLQRIEPAQIECNLSLKALQSGVYVIKISEGKMYKTFTIIKE
jgi:hypothetical protein